MSVWVIDHTAEAEAMAEGAAEWLLLSGDSGGMQDAAALCHALHPERQGWRQSSVPDGCDRFNLIVDESGASQFDRLLAALKNGVRFPDRFICAALTGTGFRGQRARAWNAMRGNLHLTAHYRLDMDASSCRAALSMIPAVAAAVTADKLLEGRARTEIKWVNDLLVNGRKVAGVLTASMVSGQRIDRAVFGIGMNLEAAPDVVRSSFVPGAGCLAEFHPALRGALPRLYAAIADELDRLVSMVQTGRADEVFAMYRNRAGFIGRDVVIYPDDADDAEGRKPLARGRVIDLNPDLSLRLEGHPAPVVSGRLAFAEHCES